MAVNWNSHELLELSLLWSQSLHNLVPNSQYLVKLMLSNDVRNTIRMRGSTIITVTQLFYRFLIHFMSQLMENYYM